jgi:hypothetical protein
MGGYFHGKGCVAIYGSVVTMHLHEQLSKEKGRKFNGSVLFWEGTSGTGRV